MKRYGLIGYPVEHSRSPELFREWFKRDGLDDHNYELFSCQELQDNIDHIWGEPPLSGFNVTYPHKKEILRFAQTADEATFACIAANTIVLQPKPGDKPSLHAFNTDSGGFMNAYRKYIPKDAKVLVLGTGGASGAVRYGLEKEGFHVDIVSRTPGDESLSYDDLNQEIIADHRVIIQATPLGMENTIDQHPSFPIPFLSDNHLIIDLIYSPEETLFMKLCKKQGSMTMNGEAMLIEQAKLSYEIWRNPEAFIKANKPLPNIGTLFGWE